MGKRNTNFRKLYLVDANLYNSLVYGQAHDSHLKEVKSLFETLNRPQSPQTQNAPPQQQDGSMNADPQNISSTSDVSMQSLLSPSNNTAHQPPQPALQSTLTNNPMPFPGFVQNAQQFTPLGAAIQQIPTIPYLNYGPPLVPRPIPGQPPAITSSPISVIQPLSQPTSVIQPVSALPAPAAPLPLTGPAAPLPIPVPAGPFAPAPRMEVDASRGTRRARSPDTVGDNGSPIIGRTSRRMRYQSVIKPEPLSAPTVASGPSEPSVSQQVVAPTNTLPSTGGRRARSEGDSSSTIDGRTVRRRTDESPIRSRTPQPTVANGSQDLGARRRTYQRVLIDPDEDFLRQNSRDTRQQRSEIEWLTCPICKISFRSDQSLRKHIERIHKEYLEQTEKGEKRDRGDQEYGRVDKKYKRIA